MPGSHRASGPSVRVWMIVVAVLLVVAVGFAGARLLGVGPDDTAGSGGPSSGGSSAGETPAAPSSPAGGTSPSGSGSPSVDPASLPDLTPAPPNRIVIDGLVDAGFDDAISPSEGHLIPTSASEAARWGDRGLPGNPATDTVVIVGADNPDGDSSFAQLEDVKPGDQVSLETYEGRLTYTVRTTGLRPVADEVDDPALAKAPGRLVLIGARYDTTQNRMGEDVFVVADLTGVTPG